MGTYEPLTRAVLDSLLQPGVTFVDGGSNVGFDAIRASRFVGPSGAVFAVEPHPRICQVLRSNIESNGCSNVSALELALGESEETAWLNTSDEPGSHSLGDERSGGGHKVRVLPLDAVMGERDIDVIKLDLEGSEMRALRGLAGVLAARRKPTLIIEFCSDWLRKRRIPPAEMLGFLRSHGYRVQAIDDGLREGPFDLDAHDDRLLGDREFNYNLVCQPRP